MIKFRWLRWFLYFVMTFLLLELLQRLVGKVPSSASYLISIVLLSLQTLAILGFLYYAVFALIFGKRLKRNKFLIFFITTFIGGVALLEILFTYQLYHPAKIPAGFNWAYKYYYDLYNFRLIQYEKDLIAFDTQLLYTLKPGANVNFRNAEFNTPIAINTKGFRDNEESLKAPEIICLGDSFTMGWGVDESQTFPEILERKTGKKVLNAGVPSYGTARELLLLDRLDLSSLKYLIIQHCNNDIDENNSFVTNNYKLSLTPFPVYKSGMESYDLSRKYFPGKNFLMISQIWMKRQVNRIYPLFKFSEPYSGDFNSREQAASFLKVLVRFHDKLKNVKIIVTNIDIYKYHRNSFAEELDRQIRESPEASEMKNIVLVNSTEQLSAKDYFILDFHINASGHEKVADKLLQAINGSSNNDSVSIKK